MIIFGHEMIAYPRFVRVESIEAIKHTQASQILYFDTSTLGLGRALELAKHCEGFECAYSVGVESIKELLLFSALGAKYVIAHSLELAQALQPIIEQYLLDCKLLCVIENEEILESIAKSGIDGVIFKQVLA